MQRPPSPRNSNLAILPSGPPVREHQIGTSNSSALVTPGDDSEDHMYRGSGDHGLAATNI